MTAGTSSTARWWRYAIALALTASICGLLLGGISAWFLGSVAIAGLSAATATTFNFFAPGAFVRLFAIGRTVSRYGERLTGHKAALGDQVARRQGLFSSMAAASSVRNAGWQLGDQSRLADYLDDVEDVDYARLRAGLPTLSLSLSIAGCAMATAFVATFALLPIAILLLGLLFAGHRAAATGAKAWERTRTARREGTERLGNAMASLVPLSAERGWDRACDDALSELRKAETAALSLRRSQAIVDAIASTIGPVSCLSVMAAAWLHGARGSDLLMPVFVGFAWLALGESANGISRIVVARVRERAASAAIGQHPPARPASPRATPDIALLTHAALVRRAPDGRTIGAPVPLNLGAGRPTALVGPSGIGKTSLLKQIAGWTGDDILLAGKTALCAERRREASTLCLHDAAILEDIVRANLFAPAASDDRLWEALVATEMDARVKQAGGLDAWIRQDMLSLGEAQRINLARAWLSDKPIVLLDEPTEHLDEEQGGRILRRLLDRLGDRIVVMSNHRAIRSDGIAILSL